MEIMIGLSILGVIGIVILGSVGLVCYLIWGIFQRNKNRPRRIFTGDEDDYTSYDNDHSYSNYHSNSNVIVPAAAGVVAGSELMNDYQGSNGEVAGGSSWDYTDYGDSGSASDSGSSDSGSSDSGSSCSSCSSCGSSSD